MAIEDLHLESRPPADDGGVQNACRGRKGWSQDTQLGWRLAGQSRARDWPTRARSLPLLAWWVDLLIADALPPVATTRRQWWANNHNMHPQARPLDGRRMAGGFGKPRSLGDVLTQACSVVNYPSMNNLDGVGALMTTATVTRLRRHASASARPRLLLVGCCVVLYSPARRTERPNCDSALPGTLDDYSVERHRAAEGWSPTSSASTSSATTCVCGSEKIGMCNVSRCNNPPRQ
jgi:hypothetical protein